MKQSLRLARTPSEHQAWSVTYGNNVYVSFTMIRSYAHAGLLFDATISAMRRDATLAWSHAVRVELAVGSVRAEATEVTKPNDQILNDLKHEFPNKEQQITILPDKESLLFVTLLETSESVTKGNSHGLVDVEVHTTV